jgi:serine/threonine-protein kinase PpkA
MSRILIVDDDAYFCSLMGLYLRARGHEVDLAMTGREGLGYVQSRPPHLVLTDFQMPQMDGFALFSAIRAAPATARLPVVMITSHRSREMMMKALGLGFDGFLGKPFSARELQELIDELIAPVGAGAPAAASRGAVPKALFEGSVLCCEVCRLEALALALNKAELLEVLAKFAAAVELAVHAEGGWLVKPHPYRLFVAFHDEPGAGGHVPRSLRGALKTVLAAQRLKPWLQRRFAGRDVPEFVVGVGVHTGQVEAHPPGPDNESGLHGEAADVSRFLAESIFSLRWSIAASGATMRQAGAAFMQGRSAQLNRPSQGPVEAIEVCGLPPTTRAASEKTEVLVEAAVERNANLVTYAAAIPKQLAAPAPPVSSPRSGADPFADRTVVLKLSDNGVVAVHLVLPKAGGAQQVVKTVLINDAKSKRAHLEKFIERYAEFRTLEHPSLARTLDHGMSPTHLFVVQEYCPGGDLRNVIAQGISADDAVKTLLRIASGLKAAHRKGLVHGDLRPANVMIRENGSHALVDFALAGIVEYAIGEGDSGVVLRSPNYLSPEVIMGKAVDERSDIYGLGLLLHEMLTGRQAYASPDVSRVMTDQLGAPVPTLPPAFERFQPLLEKLMAKKPQDRFASVQDVIQFMMGAKLQPEPASR